MPLPKQPVLQPLVVEQSTAIFARLAHVSSVRPSVRMHMPPAALRRVPPLTTNTRPNQLSLPGWQCHEGHSPSERQLASPSRQGTSETQKAAAAGRAERALFVAASTPPESDRRSRAAAHEERGIVYS